VEQATKLSSAERTNIAVALSRLVGDTFGSLATLPLVCLGELHLPDPEAAITDHFNLWRSYLVVVGNVLRTAGFGETLPDGVKVLTDCITEIRDANRQILADHVGNPRTAVAAFARMESAFQRIPGAVRDLGMALDVDITFLPGQRSLKTWTHERSLRWLGERLRDFAAGAAGK